MENNAEAEAKAQAEAEEAARKAAEEAERQAEADRQAEAAKQQAQEQEQTQPSTDQGSGNQSTGGNGGYVGYDNHGNGYTAEENAQAQAEGYVNAGQKRYYEEEGLHLVTDDDLREWGLL